MLITHDIREANKIWFISDTHFGHENIIKYARRPFETVEQMDNEIVNNWNSRVSNNDIVYHLGDFTLGSLNQFNKYFSQLNGIIKILKYEWHHDKRWLMDMYDSHNHSNEHILINPLVVLEINGLKAENSKFNKKITLCHYPMEEWESQHYGSLHLHGHVHTVGNLTHTLNKLDVGVDNTNFKPISLGEVVELLF